MLYLSHRGTRSVALLVACVSATSAHATLTEIDFGESFYTGNAPFVFLTDQLEPGYGVSFSLVDTSEQVRWYRPSTAIFGGRLTVRDPFAAPPITNELRIDFTEVVDFVQISGYDGAGGDIDTLNMRAFNSMGDLLAHSIVTDLFGPAGESIAVNADDISYVTLDVDAQFSGLFYDDLIFNTVPAPTGAGVLAIGVLGFSRRRTRTDIA